MFEAFIHLSGYTTPDAVKEISDIGAVAIAVSALVGVIWTISKIAIHFDRKRNDKFAKRVEELIDPKIAALYSFVEDRTNPIQPETNGGSSLADIHKRLDPIEAKLGLKERRQNSGQPIELPDLD